jgi:hypothetical protein
MGLIRKQMGIAALLSLAFLACTRSQSPYDIGPVGLIDPTTLPWGTSASTSEVYLPNVQPQSLHPSVRSGQAAGTSAPNVAEINLNIEGQAGGKQKLAPPRLNMALQPPGETFGSASGQTFSDQPLDPYASSRLWKETRDIKVFSLEKK